MIDEPVPPQPKLHACSHKVCSTLVLYFALFSNFCFTCFASQTSVLCNVFPSVPVKSVTRFCYALVRTLFYVFFVTNTRFVQCSSLGSRNVCCTLLLLISNSLCFVLFASPTSGLCSAFPFGSPQVYTILFFFVLLSLLLLCVLCPTNSSLCSDFFPRLPSNLHS